VADSPVFKIKLHHQLLAPSELNSILGQEPFI